MITNKNFKLNNIFHINVSLLIIQRIRYSLEIRLFIIELYRLLK